MKAYVTTSHEEGAPGFYVTLYFAGSVHDVCGPFDNHEDAEEAAERCLRQAGVL